MRIPTILTVVFATSLYATEFQILDVSAERVPRYTRFETVFQLSHSFSNPFDEREALVFAQIREPGGAILTVPAFFAQDFRPQRTEKEERLDPVGKPAWHLRFTPRRTGRHRVTLFCCAKLRLTQGKTLEFVCVESDRPGFVRVAKNAQTFEYDDGSPFFAIGLNTCWGNDTRDYEQWLLRMVENGINTGRLWIGPMQLFDPELKDGLGRYDQRAAWRLDYVLQLAERHNIRLMLCLESFNSLRIKPEYPEWQNNPYNAANGGPCKNPEDFFTDSGAKELFKRRLRYLIARWSYSPHVLAWEFWNEVDLVETYTPQPIKAWHEEMAEYIRALDPNSHLLSTSFSKPEGEADIDALPQLDFVQTHSYSGKDLAADFSAYAKKQVNYARPHLLGEFGLHWEGQGNSADPAGLHLREAIWSTAVSGSAGCGMSWWWDTYIAPRNLWPVYRPLSNFCADIPWNRHTWNPLNARLSLTDDAPGIPVDHFLKGIEPSWSAHPSNATQTIQIAADGALSGHENLAGILHGKGNHADKHNPVTFIVDTARPWSLTVAVKGVSGHGGANLRIAIDREEPALGLDFKDNDPIATETITEYNKAYTLEIPAGRHAVQVSNTGRDWLFCEYELRGAGLTRTPPLRVLGRQARDMAFGWIQNTTASHLARTRGQKEQPLSGGIIEIDGLLEGTYTLELWDTRTASYETRSVRVKSDRLRIPLPRIDSDLAFKLRRN